jgi:hypothetical protein
VPFKGYADDWLAVSTSDEMTRVRPEYEFRLHAYPTFGDTDVHKPVRHD